MTGTWVKTCNSTEDYGYPDLSLILVHYNHGPSHSNKPYRFYCTNNGIKHNEGHIAAAEECRKAYQNKRMFAWN